MADRVNRSSGRIVRKNLRDNVIEEQQRRIEKSEASLDCEEEDFQPCAVKSQGPFVFHPRGRTFYRSRERSRKKDHAPERPHGPIFDFDPDEIGVEPLPTTTIITTATARSVEFQPSDLKSDHISKEISSIRVRDNFQITDRTTDAPPRAARSYQFRHRRSDGSNSVFPTSEWGDPHMHGIVSTRRSQRNKPRRHRSFHALSRAQNVNCSSLSRPSTRSCRPPVAAAVRRRPPPPVAGVRKQNLRGAFSGILRFFPEFLEFDLLLFWLPNDRPTRKRLKRILIGQVHYTYLPYMKTKQIRGRIFLKSGRMMQLGSGNCSVLFI